MPGTKTVTYITLGYFFSLSSCFNFQYNGCYNNKKNFLSEEEQNAGFSCPGISPQPQCTGDKRYYSIDGSCNNLQNPRWGSANSPYVRLVAAAYSDDFMKFRTSSDGSPLPNSRDISTSIFTDLNVFSNNYNMLFYGFGQWIDHDMSLQIPQVSSIQCCAGLKPKPDIPQDQCMPVLPRSNDYFYSKFNVTCIDAKRSNNTAVLGCPLKPINQINFQTSWLDLSLVYGPSDTLSSELRAFKGGQLKIASVKQPGGQTFPPIIPKGCPIGGLKPVPGGSCLATGDRRLEQNPELTINEIVLSRMHNHIASGLEKANPEWNDDVLFNEARKVLIAKYQHVAYAEIVPALIGKNLAESYKLVPLKSGYATGYNSNINGQHLAEFSAAGGRILHTLVRASTIYKDAEGSPKQYLLKNKYFNMEFLLKGNTFTNFLESFAKAQCSAQDQWVTTAVTDYFFIDPTLPYGIDLVSVDINRGRDFGIAPYNTYRKACGLCQIKSFEDLEPLIKYPQENIPKIKKLYKTVDDIDLYVVGMLEIPVLGGLVGPTMACIYAELFYRAKYGDRLFYDFKSSQFTEVQLQDIRKTTYSQFLCLTNNITSMPAQSLHVPSVINPSIPCEFFGDTNFYLFKAT